MRLQGRSDTDIDFTKTQLGVLLVVMLLAVDTINPMKIIMHVFPWLQSWHVVTLCVGMSTYIWISEFKSLLYYCVRVFFQSIISIFFREVDIIGLQNIPRHGPIIFSVNHANQFVDGLVLLCTCQHKLSHLIAEKSWNRRIVGDLAWALDAVPVKRAQDAAKPGTGTVRFEEDTMDGVETSDSSTDGSDADDPDAPKSTWTVHGTGTVFTKELNIGDKIRPPRTPIAAKVINIFDDSKLQIDGSLIVDDERHAFVASQKEPVTFDILKRVDQKVVYEKVLDKFAAGGCVGIFPEGGSHDRTEMLPLKVGVALIAYAALEQDALNVPIVPVGLNYFHAHRWRGRAVVEYGSPIYLDPSTLPDYKKGGQARRKVCNQLLERIQNSMKSVLVSAPDYETLQIIHTARRLYQRRGLQTSAEERQDLSRRFSEGYRRLLLATNGDPPPAWKALQQRIVKYQKELRDLGIRDYQVPGLDRTLSETPNIRKIDGDQVLGEIRLPYQIVHMLVLLVLAAVPTLFLNLPVGILAGLYAESRRKKALANSKVKIRAYDVMLTEKILFCMVAIPTMWFIYFLILYFGTDFDGPTIALIMISLPLFAYVGIIVSEAGIVDFKDLRPYLMRLFPSSRRRLKLLPAMRQRLQVEIREFVRNLGPAMADLYYEKELDWEQIIEKSRSSDMNKELMQAVHDEIGLSESEIKKTQ